MPISMGEKIKIVLKRRNMTTTELAEKIGTSRQNLTNKFKRNNFSEKEIAEIAAVLDCKQIAENLSSDITKVIIGTILGYLAKSFFETKEAEKVRLEEEWRNGE